MIPRLFGTNGIRGVVGTTMTADLALGVGRAVGTHFEGGEVAVARDTRTSGPMLRDAVLAGLLSAGCEVTDIGIAPTPCLQRHVARVGTLSGGVIVTASHNPPEYNGIKVVDGRGIEISRQREEVVERLCAERTFASAGWNGIGRVREDTEAIPRYVEDIVRHVDSGGIRRRAFRVVLDPGHGAGCASSPRVLSSLGSRSTMLNGDPDGSFPGRLPEPTRDHLTDLARVVADVHADLGVAHDGDADRAIFVDDRGRFVDGDRSFALLAREAVRSHRGTVVTPVSTSSCVEDVVRPLGARVVYTAVGAPIVTRTMLEIGATIGGEENGGVIFPEHVCARDGAMSMAKMLDLLARAGRPLSALLDELPGYALHKMSIPVPPGETDRILAGIRHQLAGQDISTIDGIKLREPRGWVLMRPSGTESIFRVFAEARTPDGAKSLAEYGAQLVRAAIGG